MRSSGLKSISGIPLKKGFVVRSAWVLSLLWFSSLSQMHVIPALFLPLGPDVVMRFPGVQDALRLPGSWGSLSRLMNPVIDVLVAEAGVQPEVVNFLVSWFSWGLGEKEWSSKNSIFILGPNCNTLKPFDWKIQAPGRMFNAYEKDFSFLFFSFFTSLSEYTCFTMSC